MVPVHEPTGRSAPDEAVALLEEAQCASPEEAAVTLRHLALNLQMPHPSVTAAALELLQVHPLQTIPHLASLIPATSTAVQSAMEAFSDLLSSDRTLLVPIIAALPSLPLTTAQLQAARATLSHALRVVDANDLPAVVHAISRLSANTAATSRWAARALRSALTFPPPDPQTVAVLAHVLPDLARPGSAVGSALRTSLPRGAPPSWLDLVLWLHALCTATGPYLAGYKEAANALRIATSSRLLLIAGAHPVHLATPALREGVPPEAVRAFVRIVLESLPPLTLVQLAGFVRLVRALLRACPNASRAALAELLLPQSEPGAIAAEITVLSLLDTIPLPARRSAATAKNAAVSIAAVTAEQSDGGEGIWSATFITLRKGLLFGDHKQLDHALSLAREVVCSAPEKVVTELITVMDSSVATALSDAAAVSFLGVVAMAVMRGMLPRHLAERLFSERVMRQCPKGFTRVEIVDGDDDEGIVHIDAGLVCEQGSAAVAVVASASAALILGSRLRSSVRDVFVGMTHTTVLVPVVCLPVYEAVEDCNRDFDVAYSHSMRGSRHGVTVHQAGRSDIPGVVTQMGAQAMSVAISAFAVGMSAIVGILNVACTSLELSHRAVRGRSETGILEEEKNDRKVMWAILERLTEFDRMLNAMLLGIEVLRGKFEDRKKAGNTVDGHTESAESFETVRKALSKAEHLKEALLRSVFIPESNPDMRRGYSQGPVSEFPNLSLNTSICCLIAVPDEADLSTICDVAGRKPTRDIEIMRIDKLLLRHMLQFLKGGALGYAAKKGRGLLAECEWTPGRCNASTEEYSEQGSDETLVEDVNKVYSMLMRGELDGKEDIFYGDSSDDDGAEGQGDTQTIGPGAIRWADRSMNFESGSAEYFRSAMSSMRRKEGASPVVHRIDGTTILHSPEFAAVLLDRAATYTAVGRHAWSRSAENYTLANVTAVAGMALACLTAVIKAAPVLTKSGNTSIAPSMLVDESNDQKERDIVQAFLEEMGKKLLVGIPQELKSGTRTSNPEQHNNTPKVAKVLMWIVHTSIDAVAAALALEVLLVISEFGCVSMKCSRFSVLASLTTVYENDSIGLWSQGDLSLLFAEPFGEWCSQRRSVCYGNNYRSVAKAGSRTASEPGPWIGLHWKGGQRSTAVSRYRLNMFFNGMHVPAALCEGCAWVREMSLLMVASKDGGRDHGSRDSSSPKGFHAQRSSNGAVIESNKHDSEKCNALVQMLGIRDVLATLLQLVQAGLNLYKIGETFTAQDALEQTSNPIAQIGTSLNLLRSILQLYRRNRNAAIAENKDATNGKTISRVDADFDHLVVSASVSCMSLARVRLDNVSSWYSNENIEVSALTEAVFKNLRLLVGLASEAVWQCSELSTSVKQQYSSLAEAQQAGSEANGGGSERAAKRKSPFVRKGRRRRGGAAVDEDVSKARKLLPRLSAQCNAVTKEAQKLARVMGLRARTGLRKLAAEVDEEDAGLRFGAGLELGAGDADGDGDVVMDDDAGDATKDDEQEEEVIDGFHARAGSSRAGGGLVEETVTVHFKR